MNAPEEIMEGDIATFTWYVTGPPQTIHTSAIYYGTVSDTQTFTKNATPDDTRYTGVVKDFLKGNFTLPIQFIGNSKFIIPGTYYFRAYALIDGKHYWTEEQSFIVKAIPKHEIKIIDYPKTIKAGENASFTWEITGPNATTGFTAIVAAKESKPGLLDTSIDTSLTPYTPIVNDFTNSSSSVPLRFVGNAKLSEAGTYYFRAVTFINDKNIWTDEYSFTVQ